jgi:hypothetical protein
MKSALFALMLSAALPVTAHAKITVFSTADAVRKFVASDKMINLEQTGSLSSISVLERNDSNALQAFELTVNVSHKTSIGPRPCMSTVEVMVVMKKSDTGVVYSEMLEPIVTRTACAP